ncbi:type III secretion system translocon subunit SctE [Burkholderia ubonensis]|uniref:type III secretion system translocon subunit SctE n=1 Tax=Burkholderia ubonensis TaxID=101571 RepID=UPI000758D185|nr:type III secretion system translocon subunit SctE [Burkholderia ubonensis]KVN41172.1 pathogenicity island 1 effector protein SipB [Burkholderia ubonensis]
MSGTGAVGRSSYLNNPALARAAFEMTRSSASLVEAAQLSVQQVLATRIGQAGDDPATVDRGLSKPELQSPQSRQGGEMNSAARLTLLLGQLMTLLGDVSIAELEARLAVYKSLLESREAANNALSRAFRDAVEEAEEATGAYETALRAYEVALRAAEAAQRNADEAEEALAALDPDDPGYAVALARRNELRAQAQQSQAAANTARTAADSARAVAAEKAQAADALAEQVQTQDVMTEVARNASSQHLTNVARMSMLMAMFSKILGENSETSLQNDLALFEAMQAGRQKEMEKKSAEYQEEVRKAEETKRVMGCIGKILGALLAIVSVVAAAFTGGASLALAAVGVALMIADEITAAVTGKGLMERVLNPFMEYVLKPLMELIGKMITAALEKLGVDKKVASLVGSILGAIVAVAVLAVLVVAAVVLGKSAGAKAAGAVARTLGDNLRKMLPQLLKEITKKLDTVVIRAVQRVLRGLGMQADDIAMKSISNTLNMVSVGGGLALTGAQIGGGLAQGVFMKKASDALADFTLARAAIDQLEQSFKQALSAYEQSFVMTQNLIETMSRAQQQQMEANRFVLRRTRA